MSALAHEGSSNKHGIKSLPLYLVEHGITLGKDGLTSDEWMELIKDYEAERAQLLSRPLGEISTDLKIVTVNGPEVPLEEAA